MYRDEVPNPGTCCKCDINNNSEQWPYRWSVIRRWTSGVDDSAAVVDRFTYCLCDKCTEKLIKWMKTKIDK